ncbi:Ubiquitin carboxyl-terminal hydrolase 26 [Asimina triloba]
MENKHPSLLLYLPIVWCTKFRLVTIDVFKEDRAQNRSMTDGLTLITESDWKLFCEEWEVPDGKAIVAEIDIENCKSNKLDGAHEEVPSSEAHFNPSGDGLNSDLEGKSIIRTTPEVCEDCIGERESQQLMQKLNYHNEDIRVFLVHGKEVPRSVLEASGTIFEPDRRTSKRSRRNSTSSSIDLKVSGSTSIYQLKMMIWESFGVVKENQKLHKGSREIDADESATLADRNIFPGDVLWVIDTEIYENRDIADELSEPKESWQTEEGFRGTLLTSDALCQDPFGKVYANANMSPARLFRGEHAKTVATENV